jgi:hypothetical protein
MPLFVLAIDVAVGRVGEDDDLVDALHGELDAAVLIVLADVRRLHEGHADGFTMAKLRLTAARRAEGILTVESLAHWFLLDGLGHLLGSQDHL